MVGGRNISRLALLPTQLRRYGLEHRAATPLYGTFDGVR
jgi:hypothetical protein